MFSTTGGGVTLRLFYWWIATSERDANPSTAKPSLPRTPRGSAATFTHRARSARSTTLARHSRASGSLRTCDEIVTIDLLQRGLIADKTTTSFNRTFWLTAVVFCGRGSPEVGKVNKIHSLLIATHNLGINRSSRNKFHEKIHTLFCSSSGQHSNDILC